MNIGKAWQLLNVMVQCRGNNVYCLPLSKMWSSSTAGLVTAVPDRDYWPTTPSLSCRGRWLVKKVRVIAAALNFAFSKTELRYDTSNLP